MDTPDIETAQKVWRWNSGGLGYSKTGYAGPYGLAMTQGGEIVADFITAGTLDCATLTVLNLIANNVQLSGNFKSVSGTLTAWLWAGVFRMMRGDKEFLGISTTATDDNNGKGIINVNEVVAGVVNSGTQIVGDKITTGELHCDMMSLNGGAAQNVYWAWSAACGGYIASTSPTLN